LETVKALAGSMQTVERDNIHNVLKIDDVFEKFDEEMV
jgi:hypothetical protein